MNPLKIPTIYLINGKRYSGKTTLGRQLAKSYMERSFSVKHTSFAEVMKHDLARERGLSFYSLMHDRVYKETYRSIMIHYAESKKIEYGPYYWAQRMIDTILSCQTYDVIIISDWRFVSEEEYIRKNINGQIITIRVHASDESREKRGWRIDHSIDMSVSECALDEHYFDINVNNEFVNGSAPFEEREHNIMPEFWFPI